MQLMETHRRKPSFTWSDVALTVLTVRAQRTSRWWLICEYHRTHSEKIHRRKKESLNMLFFFFPPWVGYNPQWQHSNKLRSHFLQLRNCIAFYKMRKSWDYIFLPSLAECWWLRTATRPLIHRGCSWGNFVLCGIHWRPEIFFFFLKRHLPAVVTSICTPRSSAWSQVATLSTTARRGSFTGVLMTIYSNSHWNDAANPQIAKSSAAVWQQYVINSLFSRQQTLLRRFILSTIF